MTFQAMTFDELIECLQQQRELVCGIDSKAVFLARQLEDAEHKNRKLEELCKKQSDEISRLRDGMRALLGEVNRGDTVYATPGGQMVGTAMGAQGQYRP